jgi:hypothetical protein
MAEVVSIADRQPIDQSSEPVQELVDRLEELLVEAKAGRIRWACYGCVTNDDIVRHGYVGFLNRHTAVAAATYLQRYVLEDILEHGAG